MIPVFDTVLSKILLHEMTDMVEQNKFGPLLDLGFKPSDLDVLRSMPANKINRLAPLITKSCSWNIDYKGYQTAMDTLNRRSEEEALFEYFVEQRAPIPMLRVLFKASREQIDYARLALGKMKPEGRVVAPLEKERQRIVTQWFKFNTSVLLRQRYYDLHQLMPEHSISTLYSVVNQAEE